MDTEDTLRRLIHKEMRARFAWHRIEKLEPHGSGYSIVISVQPNSHEYEAAAGLTVALKKQYRDVHLTKVSNYLTINHHHIYSMCITCAGSKVVSLPWKPSRAA